MEFITFRIVRTWHCQRPPMCETAGGLYSHLIPLNNKSSCKEWSSFYVRIAGVISPPIIFVSWSDLSISGVPLCPIVWMLGMWKTSVLLLNWPSPLRHPQQRECMFFTWMHLKRASLAICKSSTSKRLDPFFWRLLCIQDLKRSNHTTALFSWCQQEHLASRHTVWSTSSSLDTTTEELASHFTLTSFSSKSEPDAGMESQ